MAVSTPAVPDDRVPDLDPVAAQRWHARVPSASPWLHETVGERMAQRLDWIVARPQTWVSWSPLLGGERAHRAVARRYPEARVWLAGEGAAAAQRRWQAPPLPWWRRWKARAAAAPAPESALAGVLQDSAAPPEPVGLIWANMALHTVAQPRALLQRWHDWLAVDGFLMFSCLGPDTGRELRAVHAAQGWPAPAPAYVDMHDWGDQLVALGFADPVMDMERLTLAYPNAERLLADLRESGRNWHVGRFGALRGRGWRARWLRAMEDGLPRNAEGQLCVTVEIVYGHAFRPAPRLPVAPVTNVPLERLRQTLRAGVAGDRPAPPHGA
ncbi:BioC: malonyl-acyl carrier protein O-methyltransferase BioC [Tepidimonas thermarum]|uniref:BioC: malonyl-acyl carrier protein O-methyltransferase BioC n=1 Tax=Tepidimonas thermarum TaxID=335431 RepID=A0A554WWZ6_9BURK|nr:biotin synthase [Tepidimonas thermarum]TSE28109.1 BioC: malonyl-acyl carrier protein O-methyltransferase BioC [Tepidimonas thermarum]